MRQAINHAIYRAKYRYGRHLNLQKPVDVSLELSSLCNMKCSYCYHASKDVPFKTAFMEWDTARNIIDDAAELGVPALKFNWKGESTLNPNFAKILTYAKSLAHGSTFIDRLTNSNFKFDSRKDEIFQALACQTKVKVSFDSFKPEVFHNQRTGGDWSITFRNIDIFYNHAHRIKSGTQLVIQAVRTRANKDEEIEFEAKRRWPEATISIRDMVEGRIDSDLSDLTNKKRDLSNRQSCVQAHVRLIFNHAGDAFACCPDIAEQHLLGNINREDITKIFNGFRAKRLRKMLNDKSAFQCLKACQDCSSFESYKGFKPVWNS